MIMLTVVEALVSMVLPNYMQLIGLAVGILGTLILAMPDGMYSLWRSLTCRRSERAEEAKAGNQLFQQEDKEMATTHIN
jgi:hypothetical protein